MSKGKINDARNKALSVVLVFWLFGVLFLYIAAKGLWNDLSFRYEHRDEIKVTARVESVNFSDEGYDEHLCLIYNVDGQEYTKIADGEQSLYGRDSWVIYLDPEDYDTFYINNEAENALYIYVFFGVMGLVCILIPMLEVLPLLKIQKMKRLKKTGLCRWLPVTKIVETEKKIVINKETYWGQYVVTEDRREEEDTVYVYKSHMVYADLYKKFVKGMKLAVYIDPKNPDNYFVDLDS